MWFSRMGAGLAVTFLASCSLDELPRPLNPNPQALVCATLTPGGQAQVVSSDAGPTLLPLRYLLTREADAGGHAAYSVAIPVEFRTADNARLSPVGEAMFRRANGCLEEVRPYLTGPAGESLAIRLEAPRPGQLGPYQIALSEDASFKHSRNWDVSWTCPAIVHEVMHLVGLVDEDRELRLGNRYDCRALGPEDSLMTSPLTAYVAATPFAECACADPANNVDCRQGISGTEKTAFVAHCPTKRASLLYAAEFRAIVAPGCSQSNAQFYACAANAYRTSTIEGCRTDLPAACAGGAVEWILGAAAGVGIGDR